MAGAASTAEIGRSLERLVRDDASRQALLERSQRFVTRYGLAPDGRTTERTVAAVRELVDRRTASPTDIVMPRVP
jgi:hypothetical protein